MSEFVVIVTGSRAWVARDVIWRDLDALLAEHGRLRVVHAACRSGADAFADEWATRHDQPLTRVPAEWDRLGKRAGVIRNLAMVAAGADLCLAYIRDNSPGASHCAVAASEAGIWTRVTRWP